MLHQQAVSAFNFIAPSQPTRASAVPVGAAGYTRSISTGYPIQVHEIGRNVVSFSRNGNDFTTRFATDDRSCTICVSRFGLLQLNGRDLPPDPLDAARRSSRCRRRCCDELAVDDRRLAGRSRSW